mgnify:CR=1 FL=1
MNFLNPRLTIQNTTGNYLVRLQHDFGDGETIDAEVFIPRGNHTLGDVSSLTIRRLQDLLEKIDPGS